MNNKRLGMKLVKMWLSEEELVAIVTYLKDSDFINNVGDIIFEVNKRGDFGI